MLTLTSVFPSSSAAGSGDVTVTAGKIPVEVFGLVSGLLWQRWFVFFSPLLQLSNVLAITV